MKLFCEPVVRTLAALGVKAEVNGRNDITIDGKKFSGNSQYLRQGPCDASWHDHVRFGPFRCRRGAACRSDEDPDQGNPLGAQPCDECRRASARAGHAAGVPPYPAGKTFCVRTRARNIPLTPDDLAAVEKLRAERYATWEWNYGRSPACTMLRRRRVDGCGLIEAYITVEHGLISVVVLQGGFLQRGGAGGSGGALCRPYAGPRRLRRRWTAWRQPATSRAAGGRVDRHPVRGIKKRIAAIAKSSDGIYVTFKNIKRSCRNHGSSVFMCVRHVQQLCGEKTTARSAVGNVSRRQGCSP